MSRFCFNALKLTPLVKHDMKIFPTVYGGRLASVILLKTYLCLCFMSSSLRTNNVKLCFLFLRSLYTSYKTKSPEQTQQKIF